jgi:cytosine/adenosine deaminase-related metal-dependent hydrolase
VDGAERVRVLGETHTVRARIRQLQGMSAHADRDAFAAASTAAGVGQCLRFGVTSVGDISSSPAATRRVLGGSPLRGVSFGEVLGTGSAADERLIAALDRSADSGRLRAGIEPHAPYTVDLGTYRRCLAEARSVDVPLATHLAETPDEAEFLASGTGEFARLWTTLRGHVPDFTRSQCGPIRAMEAIGLLDSPAVLAHVNYASDEELELLARGRASVVYCPRTHEYFGHPPHRFEDMLSAGINVAAGTDSVASSPDLNLLDDLRLIHRGRPHVPVQTLVEMATIRGARALGMAHRIGTIEPGKSADFCAFKATSSDPLREVLETQVLPDRVWIGGEAVYAAAPAP